MQGVLRKLRQLRIGTFFFLKINWFFVFTILPFRGIMLGAYEGDLFTVMINSMTFSVIFSSAMTIRTSNIIMRDLREIREEAERAR